MMLGRRSCMITGAAAAADFSASGGAAWAAETPLRYPDPNIKVLDTRFQKSLLLDSRVFCFRVVREGGLVFKTIEK